MSALVLSAVILVIFAMLEMVHCLQPELSHLEEVALSIPRSQCHSVIISCQAEVMHKYLYFHAVFMHKIGIFLAITCPMLSFCNIIKLYLNLYMIFHICSLIQYFKKELCFLGFMLI